MTWFGLVSAWGAVLMAALFGVNAYFQFATGISGWIHAVAALVLLTGSFRTLRKMSGGLRLLAGAWGLAAGLLMLPVRTLLEGVAFDVGGVVLALTAVLGLALAVLQEEAR